MRIHYIGDIFHLPDSEAESGRYIFINQYHARLGGGELAVFGQKPYPELQYIKNGNLWPTVMICGYIYLAVEWQCAEAIAAVSQNIHHTRGRWIIDIKLAVDDASLIAVNKKFKFLDDKWEEWLRKKYVKAPQAGPPRDYLLFVVPRFDSIADNVLTSNGSVELVVSPDGTKADLPKRPNVHRQYPLLRWNDGFLMTDEIWQILSPALDSDWRRAFHYATVEISEL